MSWNQVTIDVPDDLIDAVVGELSGHGIGGVWESHSPETGLTRLVLYFGFRCDLEKIQDEVQTVFSRMGRQTPAISRKIVEECDWTEEWKKSYTSFEIADNFFIVPSWENPFVPADRLLIRIDPGQAFGTGTHETTQLAMGELERWVEPTHVVLDLGTGSGILAIASRMLGAKKVFACDIDPVAVQVARANIIRNAEDGIWTFCGSLDAVSNEAVHLLIGNLTADLIIDLLPEVHRVLKPNGIAIFSGVLQEQIEDVTQCFARFNFLVYEEVTRGEWLALVCEKHVP
jgi:ribosomal protein L11 methyltransferase